MLAQYIGLRTRLRETCPICCNDLNDLCSQCHLMNNEYCPQIKGKCGHIIHYHCFNRGLNLEETLILALWNHLNRSCPLCLKEWL